MKKVLKKPSKRKSSQKSNKWFQKVQILGLLLLLTVISSVVVFQRQKSVLGIAAVDNYSAVILKGERVAIPRSLQFANGSRGNPSIHALGAIPSKKVINPHVSRLSFLQEIIQKINIFSPVYAKIDMSQYNPPIGDQGQIDSCTTWAIGYYMRGWYAKRDGYYPFGGFAPMYLYSQLYQQHKCTNLQDCGTTGDEVATLLFSQGIDTQGHYSQGNYSISLPTQSEKANALQYGFTSSAIAYDYIFGGHNLNSLTDPHQSNGDIETAIKATIDKGQPVAIAIPVFRNFDTVSFNNFEVELPTRDDINAYISDKNIRNAIRGIHEVFAFDYNDRGLWILNSWGTTWGRNGGALLSWDFVNQYVMEGLVIATPRRPFVKTCTSPSTCNRSCGYGTHKSSGTCDVNNRLMCCTPNPTPTPKPQCNGTCVSNLHICTANRGNINSKYSCSKGYCCSF